MENAAASYHHAAAADLHLPPGFRFHPTDEELVVHYLSRKATSRPFPIPIITEVDLYKFDPWDLPEKALFGDKEWYFFSHRDRKYPNGARPNRAAASGYWKATGTDKPISSDAGSFHQVQGVKKALVFYKGRAPRGVKTSWIMHEYRLTGDGSNKHSSARKKGSLRLDDWVLCRIYKKTKVSASSKTIAAVPKMETTEESCLEDVLASLPDIDSSKLFLPRIGSFNALNDELDCVIDSCCTSNASNFDPANNNPSTAHVDPRIHDHYSRDHTSPQKKVKPSPKQPVNADLEAVRDQLRQESKCNYLEEDPHDQDFLLLRANTKLNDRIIQTIPTLREAGKMNGSCYMQENDLQSTCRFPIISGNNLLQQINIANGSPPTRMQESEYTQSHLHSINCITKLECELDIFPKINGLYVQSYN